jgi:hypothetical protein
MSPLRIMGPACMAVCISSPVRSKAGVDEGHAGWRRQCVSHRNWRWYGALRPDAELDSAVFRSPAFFNTAKLGSKSRFSRSRAFWA